MVRIGLTICLIFVTAAGPWLCCCTAGQLAALASRSDQPAKPASAPCCCDTSAGAEDNARESPTSPERHCPCQEHRPMGTVGALAKLASSVEDTTALAPSVVVSVVDRL